MFIGELTNELQVAFLNLAHTMMIADGEIAKQEKRIFESYAGELKVDLKVAHKVDFDEEIKIFTNCSTNVKKKVFYELYAIALIDERLDEAEKVYIDSMKKNLGISDDTISEMKRGLEQLIDAYKHIREIVEK